MDRGLDQGRAAARARHVIKADPVAEPERFARLSPIAQIHAGAPPFFVVHGDADSLIPVEEARRFAAALRARSGAPVQYLEVAGAEHAFDLIHSRRAATVFARLEVFLDAALSAAVAPAPVAVAVAVAVAVSVSEGA